MKNFSPALLLIAIAVPALHATTMYSVAGPGTDQAGLGTSDHNIEGQEWTQALSYSNVSVTADVGTFSSAGTIEAYLTNQVGPGTTAANVIAFTTVPVSSSTAQDITIFSNLSLSAGTYYLILTAPTNDFDFWEGSFSGSATTTTGPGVTAGSIRYIATTFNGGGANAAFPPSSTFQDDNDPFLLMSVDGTTTTPEPTSAALSLGGLGALALLSRRKHTPRPQGTSEVGL
jgi:MYXO-CTERM domain-containing protein